MTPGINYLLDPSVCSCFPTSYHNMICYKIKWSTLSISVALIIIIVYASSGLYTLLDITTVMSMPFVNDNNETHLWPITSSPVTMFLDWISLCVYFTIALLTIFLLCAIQLNKSWLLFLWSIVMIFMLLIDGIVTILSLRQYQQQVYRLSKQVKILFFLMIIRLIVSLCAIFISIFHFRQLNKVKSEYLNRQRMLIRYNTECASPSYDSSWTRSVGFLNPSKDASDEHFMLDLPSSISVPRTNIATVQHQQKSTMFHSRKSLHQQSEYIDYRHQRPISECNENFRYNIPLQERFYQQKTSDIEGL
ncbi:unnamed protein product [Rotaria magnacalcarata]|uniref:Uncharacterized protein n=3 Tax=Rotaria magnacalcarata TaxID=392030 RepID=A0A815JIF3_9BILA|nr:unnamed protein product [Rotaria magnacalcarata]CAF1380010.1 unnamed protein product [Rotaria magnacalcarata]CAF3899348.1 unnamed protein product [Rotaria magnacalcarata]